MFFFSVKAFLEFGQPPYSLRCMAWRRTSKSSQSRTMWTSFDPPRSHLEQSVKKWIQWDKWGDISLWLQYWHPTWQREYSCPWNVVNISRIIGNKSCNIMTTDMSLKQKTKDDFSNLTCNLQSFRQDFRWSQSEEDQSQHQKVSNPPLSPGRRSSPLLRAICR